MDEPLISSSAISDAATRANKKLLGVALLSFLCCVRVLAKETAQPPA